MSRVGSDFGVRQRRVILTIPSWDVGGVGPVPSGQHCSHFIAFRILWDLEQSSGDLLGGDEARRRTASFFFDELACRLAVDAGHDSIKRIHYLTTRKYFQTD